jgi:hypothetical protein
LEKLLKRAAARFARGEGTIRDHTGETGTRAAGMEVVASINK